MSVLVVGLGRFGGGVGVSRWLASEGALVTVTDNADPESLARSVEAVADLNVTLHLGGHGGLNLDRTDLVVINPAVNKATSELFQEVVRRGIPWTTEMNLFCQRCPASVVGVTGSFGKSTVCTMLAAAIEDSIRAGRPSYSAVHLGGNIGRSLLPELDSIRKTDLVVLEMSNAQLEDLPRIQWAPQVAVITNLAPHHLDRYGSFEAYLSAKLNIARDPARASTVIVGELHPHARSQLDHVVGNSTDRIVTITEPDPPVELAVPGPHNLANAASVLTITRHLNLDETTVRKSLREYRGLPHRLESVREISGVKYVNDSKSTAPAATITAIEALLDGPTSTGDMHSPNRAPLATVTPGIVAIVGGQQKNIPLAACAKILADKCRAVICTGESGSRFAAVIEALSANVTVSVASDIEEAVRLAQSKARPGDTVLFSPGAPSFDRYSNFTERGRHFVDVVNRL